MAMMKESQPLSLRLAVVSLFVLLTASVSLCGSSQETNYTVDLLTLLNNVQETSSAILMSEEGPLGFIAGLPLDAQERIDFLQDPQGFVALFGPRVSVDVAALAFFDTRGYEPDVTPSDRPLWIWQAPGVEGLAQQQFGVGFKIKNIVIFVRPLVPAEDLPSPGLLEHPNLEISRFINIVDQARLAALRQVALELSERPLAQIKALIDDETYGLRAFVTDRTSQEFRSDEFDITIFVLVPENAAEPSDLPYSFGPIGDRTRRSEFIMYTDADGEVMLEVNGTL
jgi:hypothetical protein